MDEKPKPTDLKEILELREWQDFWNNFPKIFKRNDFMRQVGKTFHGSPISTEQFGILINNLIANLEINENDSVLDMCCGNGLITAVIARRCKNITGIDYSRRLIEVAGEFHSAPNIAYYHMNALTADLTNLGQAKPFNKVYMYEALQHFSEDQFPSLLKTITGLAAEPLTVYIASIPDKDRIWNFNNTPELKEKYLEAKNNNKLQLGTWWDKEYIRGVSADFNLECDFLDQPAELYTANYRFDLRLKRK